MGKLLTGIRDSYTRKFAALLLVTVLLVGGAGTVIYVTVDNEITAETEETLTTTTTTHGEQLDSWLQLTSSQIESLGRANAVRNSNLVGLQDQLDRVSERNAIAGTYFVEESTGKVILDSGRSDAVDSEDEFRPVVADQLAQLETDSGAR